MQNIFTTNYLQRKTITSPLGEISTQSPLERLRGKEVIAYFSMEYGIKDELPIYSGGLGVLAGDTLKSAADLKVPMLSIGILWRQGYYKQVLKNGEQAAEPQLWEPENTENMFLTDLNLTIDIVDMHGATLPLKLRVWRYDVQNENTRHDLPLFLLDANHPDNEDWMKDYTRQLYDSQHVSYKIMQRYLLGVGGMKLLDKLQKTYDLKIKYHLNEGHASMAIIEYLNIYENDPGKMSSLSDNFTFTIHTPVKAGLDRISINELYQILPGKFVKKLVEMGSNQEGIVSLPYLAIKYSNKTNAVAELHGEVTRRMFSEFKDKITHITNGVYSKEKNGWLTEEIKNVLISILPTIAWQENPEALKNWVLILKGHEQFRIALQEAHQQRKNIFTNYLNENSDGLHVYPKKGPPFENNWLTVGFARRFAPYKRADLIFHDTDQLSRLAKEAHNKYGRGMQFVFSGKAHPKDDRGKEIVKSVNASISNLNEEFGEFLRLKFIVNYNMSIAKKMVSGVDFWLNTPLPPMEASGTSGMKAALNGVPSWSTIDGWWNERKHNCGITFGTYLPYRDEDDIPGSYPDDAKLFYKSLKDLIFIFYNDPGEIRNMMANSLLYHGSYFNTHRMVREYLEKMWKVELLD